ncbi:MAG: hypothetical protein JEZ14_09580 [Marinilabiliaceae bacterium]|nr:hypothetical protein [Marinilabiliaceae bacterium]
MKKYWGYFLAVLLLGGCIGDEFDTDKLSDDISISPGIALPLGYAELSMKDILSEETDNVKYYKDENGNERILLYQNNDSLSYLGVNDFFELPETSLEVPVYFAGFKAENIPPIDGMMDFSIPNARLSSMEISYTINLTGSNFAVPVNISMYFPTINEQSGGRTITTQLSGDQNVSFSFSNDTVVLIDELLPVSLTVLPAVDMDIYPNEIGSLTLGMNDVEFYRVKGIMTETAVSIDEDMYELDLDVLNEFPDGITFADPRLHLISNNSTPFKGIISSEFKGKTESGVMIDLATEPIPIKISANDALKACVIDTTTLDKSNSNLKTFMEGLPEKLYYNGDLVLNPGGELAEEIELDETDRIYVGYSIELPIELIVDSTIMDIDTLHLSENDILKKLARARLIVTSENGLPFDVNSCIYLYDTDLLDITDSIKSDELLLNSASVGADGIVTEATNTTAIIGLTESQIVHLQEADELFIRLSIASSGFKDDKPVVLLTTNKISMHITLKGQLKY